MWEAGGGASDRLVSARFEDRDSAGERDAMSDIDVLAYRFRVREELRQLFEDAEWSSTTTLRTRAREFRRDHGVDVWPELEAWIEKVRQGRERR